MHKLRKGEKKRIASKKINYLFKLALKTHDKSLAINAIKTAKKLSTKFRVQISKNLKRKYCKHCHIVFNSANNVRVRIKKNLVEYCCLNCNKRSRFPFTKERLIKSQ